MDQAFDAELHDSHRSSTGVRGRLDVDAGSLVFVAYDTDQVIDLPLSTDIEMRLGGAGDNLVFFSHPAIPGVAVHTADRRILDHPMWQDHQLGQAIRRLRRQRSWLAVSLWVGAGLALVAALLFMLAVVGLVTWVV